MVPPNRRPGRALLDQQVCLLRGLVSEGREQLVDLSDCRLQISTSLRCLSAWCCWCRCRCCGLSFHVSSMTRVRLGPTVRKGSKRPVLGTYGANCYKQPFWITQVFSANVYAGLGAVRNDYWTVGITARPRFTFACRKPRKLSCNSRLSPSPDRFTLLKPKAFLAGTASGVPML